MSLSDLTPFFIIMALVSAMMSFAGLSYFGDGTWWQLALTFLVAFAVMCSLIVFWKLVFDVVPRIEDPGRRRQAWALTISGMMFVVMISCYWNVASLAQNELEELTLTQIGIDAEQHLTEAVASVGAFQGSTTRLKGLAKTLGNLAEAEESYGAITGLSGRGGLAGILRQMQANVEASVTALDGISETIRNFSALGQSCLASLRRALKQGDELAVASQADCVNQSIADLSNLGIAEQVAQSLRSLTTGVIIPPSIQSDRQKAEVAKTLDGIQTQADDIAAAAEALAGDKPKFVSTERPNMVRAILIHWMSILPAIATALAIDLLPGLILGLKCVLVIEGRKKGEPDLRITAQQIADAEKTWAFLNRNQEGN